MFSNRLAFAALAAGCIAAAAGGGYLASRQNAVPAPLSATSTTSAPALASAPPLTAERPVQETEAVVGDTAKPARSPEPASAATRTPSPSVSKRDVSPRASARDAKASARTSARQDQAPAPGTLSSSWPSSQAPVAPNTPAPIDSRRDPPTTPTRSCRKRLRNARTAAENLRRAGGLGRLRDRAANDSRVTSETARRGPG